MSVLRAHLAMTAAGVMAAGVVFNFSGEAGRAAEIIQIPENQQTVSAEETVAVRPPEAPAAPSFVEDFAAEPRLQVAQFPPPPFYIDRPAAPQWSWPWERQERQERPQLRERREMRSRETRPRESPPENQFGQRPKKHRFVREPDAEHQVVTERPQREPSFALTRHLHGSYKQRIASLLDQPHSFPETKGPLLMTVSIAKQTVTLYEGGVQIAKSPVSTGTPAHPTPLGVFSVLEKQWWHRSNIYSAAPMPFMQRITWSGVALHAGELPGYRASHGCVRLPESFALKLWYTSGVGARVVIAWNELKPADIAHPLLFQPTPPPVVKPEPEKPPQVSPREIDNAPVMVKYTPPSDDLERLRDHMMTAVVDDGESYAATETEANEEEDFPVQPAMAFLRLDGTDALEAQPVLDMLSARSKFKRHHLSRVFIPEYEPESVLRPGPVSVFVSRHDGRIYVRKGLHPVFDMPVTIAQPSEAIGTHVFTAVSADKDAKLRWMVVSPTGDEGQEHYTRRHGRWRVVEPVVPPTDTQAASAALDRIGLPQAAIDRIDEMVSVGATLIVSDAGLGRTASIPDTDFSVVLRGE